MAQAAAAGSTAPDQAGSLAAEQASSPALETLQQYILQHGIKYVVFDMDLTVTAEHSGGLLLKFDEAGCTSYIDSALRTDALQVMQLCSRLSVRMGVVTFQQETDDELHVGGKALVRRVLCRLGMQQLIDDASVIALEVAEYRVMVSHQDSYDKNEMLQQLFSNWGLAFSPSETLLIDDTARNVKAFASVGGHGIAVHGRAGLDLRNVTYYPPARKPLELAPPGSESKQMQLTLSR
jgi:hypothetical protein